MSNPKTNRLTLEIQCEYHELIHEPISVAKAAELDYGSFNEEGYSSFVEMRKMIDCVNFTLMKNNKVVYSSKSKNDPISFNLIKGVYDALKSSFCMSETEIENFNLECEVFLDSENGDQKLPYELLLAKHIFNGEVQLSLSDFENMEIKKYEKIQLALGLLRKKVNNNE